jgi:16S rRNA A1518/A1519 N6-dimethyltransferase RsmA/KsgA/DIM1 with predicted DNA glycosylase/AP lyase activity
MFKAHRDLNMRLDLEVISSLVTPGARVLDLGCGDGSFLRHLRNDRGAEVLGLEIDPALLHDLHDTLLKIRRCRVRLFQHQSSLIIDRDQIGKSTSDICCCPHNDFSLLIKPSRNNLQNR